MKGIIGHTKEIVKRAREGGRLTPFPEIYAWPIRENVVMRVDI